MERNGQSPDDRELAARGRAEFAAIQDENGVDLTLIRHNILYRTPLERVRAVELAADQTRLLYGYGRRARRNSA